MSQSVAEKPRDRDDNCNILEEAAVKAEPEFLSTSPAKDPNEQTAEFFDPKNEEAAKIREKVAMETLDELLDYLLNHKGSVGILDATNSTIERRELIHKHIQERAPKLGVVFIESVCEDNDVSC